MKRMIGMVVSLVLCMISLNYCTKPDNQPQIDSILETNVRDISDTLISSYEEYENTDRPLIASDPDNNVFLYGVKPQGVVVVKDGTEQFFDWSYLTPRGILPEITTADFDGDGTNEIGVNLYVESGTGMSVEQLHIVKSTKDSSGNDCLVDYQFMEDDYTAQIAEILQHTYDTETKILTLQVRDKNYEIVCERGFQYLSYTDIVQFRFENNGIKVIFPLGIVQEGVIAEYGYGSLTAGVIYGDEKFTLTEPEFDETLDISLLHRNQLH